MVNHISEKEFHEQRVVLINSIVLVLFAIFMYTEKSLKFSKLKKLIISE